RNAWGSSAFLDDLRDPWQAPPPEVFTLTRPPEGAPDRPVEVAVAFEEGVPRRLDDRPLELAPLVRELNDLAGTHGVGRTDVVEDGLVGIKTRGCYGAPAAPARGAAPR